MKIILIIWQLILIRQIAFSQDGQSQLDDLPKYPLKNIKHYCQGDTLHSVFESFFYYDENNKLIKSVSYSDSSNKSVKEFEYNKKDLVSVIYQYELTANKKTNERKLIFTYDNSSQLTSEEYENFPNLPRQINNYNKKGQLVAKTIFGLNWKQEITFEYNKDGHLIEKCLGPNKIITYEYLNGILVKEVHHSRAYNAFSFIVYNYNNSGLIESKKEKGKTIEKYIYKGGKLFQKWENYYGIDPCFSAPCCMQTLETYYY